jgi:peroxiredoxin
MSSRMFFSRHRPDRRTSRITTVRNVEFPGQPPTLPESCRQIAFGGAPVMAVLMIWCGILGWGSPCASAQTATEAAAAAPQAATPAVKAGHSYHGEAFNDGPRQRAYLMGNTGSVKFPVTTGNSEAQQFVEQGLGQLHGFWYFEAERSFRQAARLDPGCAMAYWGMAQANVNNEKRAKIFIAEAAKRKATASEREKMYIESLEAFYNADAKKDKERHEAYARALEKLLYKFPDDLEAKALLGLQLWINRNHGIPISSHLAVDSLLKEVIAQQPLHPCHHYRIHLWDYEKPELALDSAARCGQGAAGIAHMWHMPGHIYARVERYADAIWQQEASARADHAYMIRDRIFPDQIHNYAHNNEWLIRDLSHVGRVRDAIALARNLSEIPRHPKYNTIGSGKSADFGRARLFEELTRFELWDELIRMCETLLEPTEKHDEQLKRLRYLGSAHFRKGDFERGMAVLGQLQELLREQRKKLDEPPAATKDATTPAADAAAAPAAAMAELRPEPAPLPIAEERARQIDAKLRPCELAIDEVQGHLNVLQGDYRKGLALLRSAGGVDALYLARVELLAGDKMAALASARSTVDSRKNQTQPLAILVDLLWQAGEKKEAKDRFEKLRELSDSIDRDVPAFARLSPIAAELGYPLDWRVPAKPAADVGERPALDSLGPFLWQPSPATDWTLADALGAEVSLTSYRGRSVIVIFYLGHECLHCAEQLQAFAPMTKDFADAGISLVAISSDSRDGLLKSIENYKVGPFPFPLVSDSSLSIFRAYRAYDDFEDKPLHGTFFIDANGLVRWHDVGFEPFQDAKFLLGEAKRLLAH